MGYVIFEGCDYTGKTTLAKKFVKYLNYNNEKAMYTKEPGSPWSDPCVKIRELIINETKIKNPETYSYLFAADSFEHMTSVVYPALDNNVIVVSDRCVISDFAYRPHIPLYIRSANLELFLSMKPVVILCTASIETIKYRFKKRKDTNKFEEQHVMQKIEKISNAYDKFFATNNLVKYTTWESIEYQDSEDLHKEEIDLFDFIFEAIS